MFIQTEDTGNPQIVKFLPGRGITGSRNLHFADAEQAAEVSPLACRLFSVDGVGAVSLGAESISITKDDDADWAELRPSLLRAIMEHFTADEPVLTPDALDDDGEDEAGQEIADKIRELIDTRIQPAVAQNGGVIEFRGFEDGIALLDIQGPAVAMLSGIENMLRHYVPEITAVQSFEEYERLQKPEMNTPEALAIRELLATQINPSVAEHGGHIALIDVKPETVYIRLEGGCQGCGMADVTLKNGIETAIKQAVPAITAVLDVTDHAGGDNPYYSPGKGGASPL
jgi:Fe-S cluster biogenesis protein NfuA